HGQHQVSGILARQAFEVLKDSSWGPVKLYRTTRFDTAGTTLLLQGGALDPVAGQSYHQLAMAGRSRHRSQDMGQLQRPGPSVIRLGLVETREGGRGKGEGDGLFAGVDTVLHGQARFVALVDTARALLNPSHPAAIVPVLARALHALGSAPADTAQRAPLEGALYDWTGVPAAWRGLPFEPPPLELTTRVVIAGEPVTLSREVVYRFRDQAIGEVRRPLVVTRAFDVAVSPDLVVWPTSGA